MIRFLLQPILKYQDVYHPVVKPSPWYQILTFSAATTFIKRSRPRFCLSMNRALDWGQGNCFHLLSVGWEALGRHKLPFSLPWPGKIILMQSFGYRLMILPNSLRLLVRSRCSNFLLIVKKLKTELEVATYRILTDILLLPQKLTGRILPDDYPMQICLFYLMTPTTPRFSGMTGWAHACVVRFL